jgi:hypothetical protein
LSGCGAKGLKALEAAKSKFGVAVRHVPRKRRDAGIDGE